MRAGKYSFEYTPYFKGVAAALDGTAIPEGAVLREVDLMKAAQIGWTYFLIGYMGKRIDTHPCPIMVLFAKEKDGQAFHDEKLIPTIESSPAMRRLVDISKSRTAGNRKDYKSFPGGFLKLVASNSPGNVKSTSSVGVGVVEEPDDTAENVRGQGDAIGLLKERLKRYPGSILVVGGTPAIKGLSKTEHRLQESDARVLPVECHECGEKHVLDWDNVSWLEADEGVAPHDVYGRALPDTAVYCCPECGAAWDDYRRQENIRQTVAKAEAEGDPYYGWVPTRPFHGAAGFQKLSELYVCLPGTTLADVVKDYLNAEYLAQRGQPFERIKFQNQKLGEPYEPESNAPDQEALEAKALEYEELTVPSGGLVLTAGVDVQHDRLAVVIRAWGRDEESWLVYWGELQAKTSTTDPRDPVWKELDKLLWTPRKSADGFQLVVESVSIDASDGTTSDQVYAWVRPRQQKGAMAVKGSSNDYGTREIYAAPKKVDFKKKTKASRWGLRVYIVGTHKAKDVLIGDHGRISLNGAGAGRMHWYADVRPDYYEQLTGEVKAPANFGQGKLTWQPRTGVRNEALDCEVYALHAARAKNLHRLTDAQWDAIERRLKQADLFGGGDSDKKPESETPAKRNDWIGTDPDDGWL